MRPATTALAGMLTMALLASACSGGADEAEPAASPAVSVTPVPDGSPGPDPGVEAAPAVPASPTPTPSPTPVPTPFAPGDDRLLPIDRDVRIGRLDNGLTFYIRRNGAPGGRAELRLAVDAGSAFEDHDQSGVAHFLEHMLFNGTEAYPANELIAVLEAFGSEFGPDVNAYTSYDETVYELSIPTDDDALVSEAFDVLREWATNATLDPLEVERERGVVVEEWRLRGQGVGGRIGRLYDELLTPGTSYEDRAPIGEVDALRSMTAGLLERFYRDWYRPDLMAVVVVGDLDVERVEDLIRSRFDDIPRRADARPVPEIEVAPNRERDVVALPDPELSTTFVELVYAGPDQPVRTVGDRRRQLAYELGSEMLNSRFRDDALGGDAPYIRAYRSTTPIARRLATPGLLAEAPAEALEASFEALLVEMERVRRDGFTPDELERSRRSFQTALEQAYTGRGTTQDSDYAAQYVDHFVGGEPIVGWDDLLDIEQELLNAMTPEYVSGVFVEAFSAIPDIVVAGATTNAAELPDEDALVAILESVSDRDVAARDDDLGDIDELMQAPEPAAVVGSDTNEALRSRTIRFANGVVVWLKTTTIAEGDFIVRGRSPGGTSVLEVSELAAAAVAGDVVTASGVGGFSQVQLDRELADTLVGISFVADDVDERIVARGATEHAETLFQLLHLYLTEPTAEAVALDNVVRELQPIASDPDRIPGFAADRALRRARFGPDRRFQPIPPVDELNALTPALVLETFAELYGDVGDLTLAVVGDFEMDAMIDLVARYVGTLPGDATEDPWIDHEPAPPPGIVTRTVRAGSDPQGSVTILITAGAQSDEARDIRLEVLSNVLGTRLRDQLRERLGATYSPNAVVASSDRPDEVIETIVQVSGNPDRLNQIVEEVVAVIDDLRSGGLTSAEVATAREQVRRDLELVSNSYWASQMLYADRNPSETMLTINQRVATAAETSVADVQALIDVALLDDQYIVVELLPAG